MVIAHRVHDLTADLGRTNYAMREIPASVEYKSGARKRLKFYSDELPRRFGHYIMEVGFDELLFEAAERTYERALKDLNRKIDKQYAIRKKEIETLNAELRLEGLTDDWHPRHSLNKTRNGRLTARGVGVCYRLFDLGKSPLAVAHMMRVSLKAAVARQKTWQKSRLVP